MSYTKVDVIVERLVVYLSYLIGLISGSILGFLFGRFTNFLRLN